jgi:hypothetical protein
MTNTKRLLPSSLPWCRRDLEFIIFSKDSSNESIAVLVLLNLNIIINKLENLILSLECPWMSTDLTMLGGIFKEKRSKIPITLCTGNNDVISHQVAKSLGIKELLLKPATRRNSKGAIRCALENWFNWNNNCEEMERKSSLLNSEFPVFKAQRR